MTSTSSVETPASSAGSAAGSEVAGLPEIVERAPLAIVARRLLIVAALVVLDLWSKAAVFRWLEPLARRHELSYDAHGHERYPILGEWFSFMPSLNPGAAFGKLDSVPYLLVFGRVGAALFLIWLIVRSPLRRPVFNTALLLVLAGALGNLYDNLLRARTLHLDRLYPPTERPFGPVRDFIDVYFSAWDWHFWTFNVADSCITVGAILLLACGLFTPQKKSAVEPRPAA